MDRRHFLAAASTVASAQLLGPGSLVSASEAAEARELRGTLRRLTEPGSGDNRATFMSDGKTLMFACNRSGKSQIWGMNATGHARRMHEGVSNDYGRVAPNADGTKLCFSSDRSGQNAAYVLELASGRVTLVSDAAFWSFGPTLFEFRQSRSQDHRGVPDCKRHSRANGVRHAPSRSPREIDCPSLVIF